MRNILLSLTMLLQEIHPSSTYNVVTLDNMALSYNVCKSGLWKILQLGVRWNLIAL